MNKNKRRSRLWAALYILLLFQIIVLKKVPFWDLRWLQGWRFEGWDESHLELFFTIDNFFYAVLHGNMSWTYFLLNIVGNVLLFVPLGYLLRRSTNGRIVAVLAIGVPVILLFETVQLFSGLGVFDVDDILLNVIGIVTGYLFAAGGGRR